MTSLKPRTRSMVHRAITFTLCLAVLLGLVPLLSAAEWHVASHLAQPVNADAVPPPKVDAPAPPALPKSTAPTQFNSCGDWNDDVCCSNNYCGPRWWVRAEYAQMWLKGADTPALVTTSPQNTAQAAAGVIGQTGTTVLFGNEELGHKTRYGGRITLGGWLNECSDIALEANFLLLGHDASTNYFASSTGNPILARPFFNTALNQEDSQLIAFPNIVAGDITITSESEVQSGSVLARRMFREGCRGTLDWVLGYRYFRLRERLRIEEDLVSTNTGGLVQQGTTFELYDDFATRNDFHGVEFGVVGNFDRGCFDFELAAKLALGTMFQTAVIDGETVITTPGDPPAITAGGLLALPTNMGEYNQNDFCLLPELQANVRYYLTDCLVFTFGYTGIYVSDSLRAAHLIDRQVNGSQLVSLEQPNGGPLVGAARPAPQLNATDLWVQGGTCGLEFSW